MSILRVATEADGEALAEIYAPIVRDTAISFELVPPDGAEMARRVTAVLAFRPWIVAEVAGEVIGYAYAGPHRDRAAYLWSVATSVYVARNAWRQGIGSQLYRALITLLRAQGFHSAFAGITLPNPGSIGLHEALGFAPCGIEPESGRKFGAWHGVGRWRLALSQATDGVADPIPFRALNPGLVERALTGHADG